MKRNEASEKYKWDFKKLYKNDEEWKRDLIMIEDMISEISKFKGKLKHKEVFKKYLLTNEKINLILIKMNQYIHMGDINKTDLLFQELRGLFFNVVVKLNSEIVFVSPELKRIGEEKIIQWIKNDEDIDNYEYVYRDFFRTSKYILTENNEKIISIVSRSRSVACELYDLLLYADKKPIFIFYKNRKEELTNTLYNKIMEESDPLNDQKFRIKVAEVFNKHLFNNKHSFARIYEGIIQKNVEFVKLRGYNDTLHASLLSDNISREIYENLINYGKKTCFLFNRYFSLLKNYFGFKKYYITDSRLKLVFNLKSFNSKYTIEKAKDIIRNSLSCLGKEYLDKLEIAWSDNKIDYFEDINKVSGAYSLGGNGVDPIILMNWDDTISSVNTLAHEIGHSVHTLFSVENNKYPLSNYSIILAEVASTINEHLLFDYLYKNSVNNDEKIFLLQNRINEIIDTFYRQIQFADFEWSAHKMVENNEILNAEKLSSLFIDKGNEFGWNTFDKAKNDSKKYGWPRISHFFNSPYYVYKYATSIVASFKLYNDVINGHPEFLLTFLKQGGRKDPLLILKDFGIDYTKETIYEFLVNKLMELIDELADLLNKKKND